MNKITFSIDSLLGLGLETHDIVKYKNKSPQLKKNGDELASPSSSIKSEDSQLLTLSEEYSQTNEKSKGPFCAKCKLHSEYYPVKNHKEKCKRRFCVCEICQLIDEGKGIRGKKKLRIINESNSDFKYSQALSKDSVTSELNLNTIKGEDIMLAANIKSDLKRTIFRQEFGSEEEKSEKLLNAILYLLLQKNRFDSILLKKKLFTAKMAIEERKKHQSSNNIGLISSPSNSSTNSIITLHSSPLSKCSTDHRVMTYGSGSSFSSQTFSCLSSASNSNLLNNSIHSPVCSSLLTLPDYASPVSSFHQQPIFSSSVIYPTFYNPFTDCPQPSSYQSSLSCPTIIQEREHYTNTSNLFNCLGSSSGVINLSKRMN